MLYKLHLYFLERYGSKTNITGLNTVMGVCRSLLYDITSCFMFFFSCMLVAQQDFCDKTFYNSVNVNRKSKQFC